VEELGAWWRGMGGGGVAGDGGVLVVRRADSDRYSPVAFFPDGEPCGPFLADAAERALYDARALAIEDGPRLGIAYPVPVRGRLEAIAAFEWTRAPEAPREHLMRSIQWGLPWLEVRLAPAATPAQAPTAELVGLGRVIAAASYPDAARAAATDLAHRFSCERVAAGHGDDGAAVLAALSHTAHLDRRLELPRAIETRMTEALHDGKTLVRPGIQGEGSALVVLAGESIFCLEWPTAPDEVTMRKAEAACAGLAPALTLQRAKDLPLRERA